MDDYSNCTLDACDEILDDVEDLLSESSISTTATADNLPGAGRVVGLAYNFLGRRIERRLARISEKRKRASVVALSSLSANVSSVTDDVQSLADSVTTLSTTATADNLPGAGRTLGKLFTFLGRRLEGVASRKMEQFGFGPNGIRERLSKWTYYRRNSAPPSDYVERAKAEKDLAKLLKYVKSDFISNQELALEIIIDLALYHPCIYEMLSELGAARIVGFVFIQAEQDKRRDHLLSPSRRALTCIVEAEMNTVGQKAVNIEQHTLYLTNSLGLQAEDDRLRVLWTTILDCVEWLIDQIAQGSYQSFLALRYLDACLYSILKAYKDKAEERKRLGLTLGDSALYGRMNRIYIALTGALCCLLERSTPESIEWPYFAFLLYLLRIFCNGPGRSKDFLEDINSRAWPLYSSVIREQMTSCITMDDLT